MGQIQLRDETVALFLGVATALTTAFCVVVAGVASASTVHSQQEVVSTGDTQTTPQIDSTAHNTPTGALPTPTPTATQIREIQENTAEYDLTENMKFSGESLEFEARFPNGSTDAPAFRKLMLDMKDYRESLRGQATLEMNSMKAEGFDWRPWNYDIIYIELAQTDKFISIVGREWSMTGGAHGNVDFDGVVADVKTGEEVELASIFKPDAEFSPALTIGICEALKTAKEEKIGDANIYGASIECGDDRVRKSLAGAELTLAPSTEAGKFGGIVALYAPYVVGPYAEGPYVVTVAHDVFADDLRPEYKTLFGGAPTIPDGL